MLAHVRGAEPVLADIEDLELGRTFDAVLLASHFVNIAEDELRRAVLATCRRHLAPDGVVLIQRLDPTAAFEEQFEDVRREGSLSLGDRGLHARREDLETAVHVAPARRRGRGA